MLARTFLGVMIFIAAGVEVSAGILPASRGGTGANLVPVNGAIVTTNSSNFVISQSLVLPAGFTIVLAAGTTLANGAGLYIPTGATLATPQPGAIETNGTNLYWTDKNNVRYKFNLTVQ